jgi:selenocysteine lyase/cysteine desulfurase
MATRNMIGILSMETNCRMLLKIGLKKIHAQIQRLKSRLRDGLKDLGYEILTPETGPQSGIITARPPKPRDVYNRLKKNKIIISLRNNWLRFSPHFYNTTEEIDRVLKILE